MDLPDREARRRALAPGSLRAWSWWHGHTHRSRRRSCIGAHPAEGQDRAPAQPRTTSESRALTDTYRSWDVRLCVPIAGHGQNAPFVPAARAMGPLSIALLLRGQTI